jgi:hypothetical protein
LMGPAIADVAVTQRTMHRSFRIRFLKSIGS